MPECFIYGLIDPRTGEVRYIGQTGKGLYRPKRHGTAAALRKDNTYRGKWIRKLAAEGVTYEVVILEVCTPETVHARERDWIAWGRHLGWRLTNLTDGGEGTAGLHLSEERKKQIGEVHRGKTVGPEVRKKIGTGQPRRRPIQDVVTGRVFASVSEARDALGLNLTCICRVLEGKQRQTKGHIFRDVDEASGSFPAVAFFNA